MERRKVAILGGGVIGLTVALELASAPESLYDVQILARDLPSTPQGMQSQDWASPWAGFNWCSFASKEDKVTQRRDAVTYMAWKKMIAAREVPRETMDMMPFKQLLEHGEQPYKSGDSWIEGFVDDFEYHPPTAQSRAYLSYTSMCVNTPMFLAHLYGKLSVLPNVSFHQIEAVSSLAEAFSLPALRSAKAATPDSQQQQHPLLINATGLGARFLSDVADGEVYPIRGQTVLIRSSLFKTSPRCVMDTDDDDPEEGPTYVIPRAASGEVICGGTFGEDDWERAPREKETARILRRCWEVCPEILDQAQQSSNGDKEDQGHAGYGAEAWRGLYKQVISINVGLRPARRGDVTRVELDAIKGVPPAASSSTAGASAAAPAEWLPVLHCYGSGKAGYQGSLGIAKEAKELVERHFAELQKPEGGPK